ncbi:MAG: hypothetical protein S4CHLAM2_10190 [Chlamydiales bacterium]|nr:hypothetical protein [Chlamydiales bacterium]
MFDLALFLAIPSDSTLERALAQANPRLVDLLTGGGDYLSTFSIEETHYLGKPLPLSLSIAQLETAEDHLISLLHKLAPDYAPTPVLITQMHAHDRAHH